MCRAPIALYRPERPYRTPFALYQGVGEYRVSQVKLPSERYRAIPLYRSYGHTNRCLARHSAKQVSRLCAPNVFICVGTVCNRAGPI